METMVLKLSLYYQALYKMNQKMHCKKKKQKKEEEEKTKKKNSM